ncbi:MAG: hypothetical protein C0465_25150 [Ralstonia sp.]|uniref:GNAT family N-acetyltransferase n=1 Tax=Ralstonia sp. TaxID=54061 RepID=UPI00257F75B8|nr:GNAT family N-acetyltransferase [Ralstonia sp.]MBA4233862.1 hypothetical protein [Ralstonia sp.]
MLEIAKVGSVSILSPMQIRTLLPSEADEAADLFIEVFSADPWREDWRKIDAERRIGELMAIPSMIALAAWRESRLLGFAIGIAEQQSEGKCLIIREFCVSSSERRKGIGLTLLAAIEGRCREEKIELVGLSTQQSSPGFSFYRKQGFSRVDEEVYMIKKIENT